MTEEELLPKESPPSSVGGCVIKGCIIMFVLAIILAFACWWGLMSWLGPVTQEYEDMGFNNQGMQQILIKTDDITERNLYTCQVMRLQGDVHNDIALIAQVVEIYGEVHGDVYFWGQTLTIKSKAIIHGNIHVRGAQVVAQEGTVLGTIDGSIMSMSDARGNIYAPPSADDMNNGETPTDAAQPEAPVSAPTEGTEPAQTPDDASGDTPTTPEEDK